MTEKATPYTFLEHLRVFHPAEHAKRSRRELKHCRDCGGFLPEHWESEVVDEESDTRRYTRWVYYVECEKCGTMNTEDAR